MTQNTIPHSTKSSPLMIALAWLVVGVPALWGVEQTFKKSLALFQGPPPAGASVSATISK